MAGVVQRLVQSLGIRPGLVHALPLLPAVSAAVQECCSTCQHQPAMAESASTERFRSFASASASQPSTVANTLSQEQQQGQQQHTKQPPDYKQIRARIFGEPITLTERTGRRALAKPLQGTDLASWYFLPPRMPGSHNEEQEYVMLRKLNKRQKKKSEDEAETKKKK